MMNIVSTPENLAIVSALCDALRSLQPGEVIAKARLDNLTKRKPHLLAKARRVIEREQGCVFATIIGTGIKRLETDQVALVGQKARISARRKLGKAQGQIVGVVKTQEGEMAAQTKLKLTNELNKLGLAVQFCE